MDRPGATFRDTAPISQRHPLRRLFGELVYRVFFADLGVHDQALTQYLSDLLTRFVHIDTIHRICDAQGRRLTEVAEMLLAAQDKPADSPFIPEREIHKHIGDFTLFWTGVYPEALRYLKAQTRRDHLVEYVGQGKRSYGIAAGFDRRPFREQAAVLRRLSAEFELCVWGLSLVRHAWEKLGDPSFDAASDILLGPLSRRG